MLLNQFPQRSRCIMELQLWLKIVALFDTPCKRRRSMHFRFSDSDILKVWFWSVIHDRPISWAVQRENWPVHLRRHSLPSNTTMSRRLRSRSVTRMLDKLQQLVVAPQDDSLYWMVDGKPLTIGGCSKDRQAGYGRAAGCMAKGYKLHAIVAKNGQIADWRIAPMNKDERVMAERMLKTTNVRGYVVADSNYDSNKLHAVCDKRGSLQLVCRRRYGEHRKMGHRKQSAGRLRSKEILEAPNNAFGKDLLAQRDSIERTFASLTNWGGGLTHLPPWVRTHRRVKRWVQAKLIFGALKLKR
jgi:hypothetical protein